MTLHLYQSDQPVPFGEQSDCHFPAPIATYLAGFSYFELAFSDAPHMISQISLSLTTSQPSSEVVTVTADAVLRAGNGQSFDPAYSFAYPVVLAWDDATYVTVATVPGLASGSESPPIALPAGADITEQQALLDGFSLGYTDAAHEVKSLGARAAYVTSSAPTNAVAISGTATLSDATGHSADAPTIDGAYFCGYNQSECAIRLWQGPPKGTPPLPSVTFGQPVSAATILLTGFSLSYPDSDYRLSGLSVGGLWPTLYSNGTVEWGAYASMTNWQTTGDGTVSFAVIGAY